MVIDNNYNTVNNFPGSNGWMAFNFNAPFTYTGGAIEIAVDWDCSQVSTPAFTGDGALKWRWESTAPDDLVVKKTASSSPPSTIQDLKDERANIQMVYVSSVTSPCDPATALTLDSVTTTTADLSWTASANAASYNWKVVLAGAGSGGTAVAAGMTNLTSIAVTGLTMATSYDLFVESDCGGSGTSAFAGPFNFMTSNNIGLADINLISNLTVSPNPTNGIAVLNLELERNAMVDVSIYSTKGELIEKVLQENVNQIRQTIDLSKYQNGLYFFIISVDGQVSSQKIVSIK
jgi:hypothetical protein